MEIDNSAIFHVKSQAVRKCKRSIINNGGSIDLEDRIQDIMVDDETCG